MPLFGCKSLHDSPIFSAVSSLSPVSIQILMPASWSEAIVYGTSSCSLSSTAVAPIRSKSRSNLSNIASSNFSLFYLAIAAYFTSSRNLSFSLGSMTFIAIRSVRRPYLLAVSRKDSVASFWAGLSFPRRALMIESAPLTRSFILLSFGSSIRTDIRLRSLVNSMARYLIYFYCSLPCIAMEMKSSSDLKQSNFMALANSTRATSSGDGPL